MYGGIWAYRGDFDNPYHQRSLKSISPLDSLFDEDYFVKIIKNTAKDLSAKALLATEQRIPGLGNGVLQDILFNAGIHPKRKKSTISDLEVKNLFQSLKSTLRRMADMGGRDTEKDLFGINGGTEPFSRKTVWAILPDVRWKDHQGGLHGRGSLLLPYMPETFKVDCKIIDNKMPAGKPIRLIKLIKCGKSLLASIFMCLIAGACSFNSGRIFTGLDSLLTGEFHSDEPGGVVLIMKGDKTLFLKCYGLADLASEEKITANTFLTLDRFQKHLFLTGY